MARTRAAWVNFTAFSKQQRERFQTILKLDPEKTQQYIDLIEPHIPDFALGSTILAETPMESAEKTREVLQQVANHSKRLWELLSSLDQDGAGLRLERAQVRLKYYTFDLGQLTADLGFLAALSRGASQWKSERNPGHPVHFPSRRFFLACVRHYLDVFGAIPKYSKGTKFQNFLKAVSAEVCSPQTALRGDLTSSIKAAIENPPRTP